MSQLSNIRVVCVGRVTQRNGYNLFIRAVVNRTALHKCHRQDSFLAKHKNIKRVAVVSIGARNKTVACRIVCSGIKHTVKTQHTCIFIKLILVFSTARYLYNSGKIIRCN